MSIPAECVGADLDVHNTLNMCYAGYHYDLNFLTIHGKSRFPGLFVWLRNGRRVAVKIPAGCLFIQAGKQLEWLTAGFVKAGMHEVSSCLVTVSQLSTFSSTSVDSLNVIGHRHVFNFSGSSTTLTLAKHLRAVPAINPDGIYHVLLALYWSVFRMKPNASVTCIEASCVPLPSR